MAGTCDGLSIIANGDDNGPACTGTAGSASWCSEMGATYYVWIAPFSTAASTAAFTLQISENGVSCTNALPTTVCAPDLSPTTTEDEGGYGPAIDDGCDSTPNLFVGMQEVHGPLEWVSLQDMQASARVCLKLVAQWAAQGKG